MQSAAFDAAGLDARYGAMRVQAGGAGGAVADLRSQGFAGFNVTTPLKEEVSSHLDALTESAGAAGAVNTVKRSGEEFIGHNTDGEGCIRALDDLWHTEFQGLEVLLLGAGPAARAIAAALTSRGARIACWSRRAQTATLIGPPPDRSAQLVISALPPGAAVPPAVIAAIDPHADVFDVNYASTRFALPADVGARRSDGIPMLLHQGALAFEWWTGLPAPIGAMRAALDLAQGRAERARTENRPR